MTLLEALTAASGAQGYSLAYAAGCDVNTPNDTDGFPAAVAAVAGADVIIAAFGLNTCQVDDGVVLPTTLSQSVFTVCTSACRCLPYRKLHAQKVKQTTGW